MLDTGGPFTHSAPLVGSYTREGVPVTKPLSSPLTPTRCRHDENERGQDRAGTPQATRPSTGGERSQIRPFDVAVERRCAKAVAFSNMELDSCFKDSSAGDA